jgi:vitamin B12 transporter
VTFLDTEVTNAGADEGPSAEYVDGERLLRRPDRVATAGVDYAGRGGLRMGVILTHTGERDDRDFSAFPATPIVLDAFTRVDASAVVPLRRGTGQRGSLSLVFRMENVFDEEYEQVLGFPSPGRTAFIGARFGQ